VTGQRRHEFTVPSEAPEYRRPEAPGSAGSGLVTRPPVPVSPRRNREKINRADARDNGDGRCDETRAWKGTDRGSAADLLKSAPSRLVNSAMARGTRRNDYLIAPISRNSPNTSWLFCANMREGRTGQPRNALRRLAKYTHGDNWGDAILDTVRPVTQQQQAPSRWLIGVRLANVGNASAVPAPYAPKVKLVWREPECWLSFGCRTPDPRIDHRW